MIMSMKRQVRHKTAKTKGTVEPRAPRLEALNRVFWQLEVLRLYFLGRLHRNARSLSERSPESLRSSRE